MRSAVAARSSRAIGIPPTFTFSTWANTFSAMAELLRGDLLEGSAGTCAGDAIERRIDGGDAQPAFGDACEGVIQEAPRAAMRARLVRHVMHEKDKPTACAARLIEIGVEPLTREPRVAKLRRAHIMGIEHAAIHAGINA